VKTSLTAREWGLLAAAGALLADQLSKLALLYAFGFAELAPRERVFTSPVLDLVMAWNPGVSFSLLSAHSRIGVWALALCAAAAILGLGVWMWRTTRPALAVGLGLVIGGALGNLLDRIFHGRVADFFDLHFFSRDFFVCNAADVAITFGVVVLLADSLFERTPKPRSAE
jgi:signal peptidase II